MTPHQRGLTAVVICWIGVLLVVFGPDWVGNIALWSFIIGTFSSLIYTLVSLF